MYTSESGKAAIHKRYHDKLASLQIEYAFQKLDTSFGETNLIVTGHPENPPLVLVHGANGCAPVALDVYTKLADRFRVYAVDVIGEPNLSSDRKMSKKNRAYGKWLKEVLDALEQTDVTLVGFSLGGMAIWQTLVEDESRIKAAYLAAPAGIVNGNPIKGIFQLFLPMRRYIKRQEPKHLQKVIENLFTDDDDFAYQFLGTVLQHFKLDFSPIQNINKTEAKQITTPITIFGAGKDLMFPGRKMLKRAEKIFPSLKDGILLEDSKHVQGKSDNDRIQQMIMN